MPKIGAHVSAAGGVSNAPLHAHEEGCEVFQFFISPPQSYAIKPISDGEVVAFKANCKKYRFTETYVHASYLVNLASPNNRIRYGSINLLKKSLDVCSRLGVKGMMFHTGSATGHPNKTIAIKKAIESLNKILDGYRGSTTLLIENAAGAGSTIGVTFREVGQLFFGIKSRAKAGVCLDTQHAFASGYDWRTLAGTTTALAEFSKAIGMRYLMVVQANDSKVDCGENRDRHEHIDRGYIGAKGFRILLHHPKLKQFSFILETPGEGRAADIALLKKLRKA